VKLRLLMIKFRYFPVGVFTIIRIITILIFLSLSSDTSSVLVVLPF
jgi:hypothetical protein